jgi:hypothetical protein
MYFDQFYFLKPKNMSQRQYLCCPSNLIGMAKGRVLSDNKLLEDIGDGHVKPGVTDCRP